MTSTHTAPFELHDAEGRHLASAHTYEDAARTLRAFAATGPGAEEGLFLLSLAPDGQEILREDVFDLD